MFPLERLDDIKNHPQDFKLLKRVPLTRDDVLSRLPVQLTAAMPGEQTRAVVFLDTETTGMLAGRDKIIELGMVRCTYSVERKIILSVDRYFDAYEDPGAPIPPEIVKLTGITDEMVKGQHFDDDLILSFFADHPLIVAHNAKFDRPFVDHRFQALWDNEWACTFKEIDWGMLGFGVLKLEFLVQSMGYFYDAHRACNDTLSLCYLMFLRPDAFKMLLESVNTTTYRVDAIDAPVSKKDLLKSKGYRWDNDNRNWYIQVNGPEAAQEQCRFLESVYREARDRLQVRSFSAKERFRA